MDKYNEVVKEFTLLRRNPKLREGQAWFNALASVSFVLAHSIAGTDYDPFYKDENIRKFLIFIEERLIRSGDAKEEMLMNISENDTPADDGFLYDTEHTSTENARKVLKKDIRTSGVTK